MGTYFRHIANAASYMGRAIFGATTGYEAAGGGRRLAAWSEIDAAITALMSSEGDTLRRRSRALVRKNAWAKNAQEAYVANSIGCGIMPEPMHPDRAVRAELKRLWKESVKEFDADGLTDFYGLQALMAREMFDAGETISRFRTRRKTDGLTVPLQLQVLESEHLPLTLNSYADGAQIRSGIEFDKIGRRTAYHLYREHPGAGAMSLGNAQERVRVPAANIIHSFVPLRAGQLRGTPWLAPIMVTLYELDQFVDHTLTRQKIANLFVGWQRAMSDEVAGIITSQVQMDGEQAPENTGFGSLEGGTVLDLGASGMTLEWSRPPDPAASFPDFVRMMLRAISSGIGMPYTLLNWDSAEVNYSSMRGELLEFRRRVEQFQFGTVVTQICNPTWKRWIDEAVLAGVIAQPDSQQGWRDLYSVEWRTPRWAWVDPLKDVEAAKMSVRSGITSRTAVIHETGYDPDEVDQETAEDNRRADALGLVMDSDPRQTQNNGAAQSAPASPDEKKGRANE